MLLVIDIGNTNIVAGIYQNNSLIYKSRFLSDVNKSIDDYAVDIIESFLFEKIDCLKIEKCIIGSVVPILTDKIKQAISRFFNGKILVIGEENVKLNIEIKLKNKNEIGADRLINSIAAYKEFGGNLIIIDFGTATTFDVVGESGEYLGGVIAPGINLSLKVLHEMTAKLPKISLHKQSNVIGKNTVEAMNSGAYFGYICLINGMIEKIQNELQTTTTNIITGGLAEIFQDEINIHHFRPDLTLLGLKVIGVENSK